jgi:hypothetical protein
VKPTGRKLNKTWNSKRMTALDKRSTNFRQTTYISKMKVIRIIGIIIMFIGVVLKIADFPGYTAAFVIGEVLIITGRLYQWYTMARKPS